MYIYIYVYIYEVKQQRLGENKINLMKLRIEAITMRTGHKAGIQPGNKKDSLIIKHLDCTWI